MPVPSIPGMSSWGALVERAKLCAGETVLINGATGTSGRLAIQIAKHLGAKKVIATGRQTRSFDELRSLGADVTVALTQDGDSLEKAFKNELGPLLLTATLHQNNPPKHEVAFP